jgi:hypothetical protein
MECRRGCGQILAPTVGDSRSEQDFAAVERLIAQDPRVEWVLVTDQLDIHRSEIAVRLVATHRIRFVYTPKHCSRLNQIEIWFRFWYGD